MNVLELFAGSRSVGREAEKLGMNVFSVDWESYKGIDLSIDIGLLRTKDIPFVPDVIWASPDCSTYSISSCKVHRLNITEPKTEYAKKCDEVNQHFISLIKEWLVINPNMIFFIENPRGLMRKMPWIQCFDRKTIWYCKYGDNRAKPTDIWTNSTQWTPRPLCRNYSYDSNGEVINKHCHHESARRGCKTSGTQGRSGSYDRSKIPSELCREILLSTFTKN